MFFLLAAAWIDSGQANRRMQFKVGNFKSSEIRMLTCALKADRIQLLVESLPSPH